MKMTFWLALMATMICSTKTLQAQNLRIYESDGNAVSYNYNQIDSLVFNVAADETEPVVVNVLGQNPWKGKRVGVLGDSISDGVHVGTEKCWWEFMSEWLGLVTTCFAQNGANISGMLTQAQQLLKVQREEGKAFDAVIIFGGTNDYNQGCTLGNWYNERTESNGVKHRALAVSTSTFRGRLNNLLNYVKKNFPKARVYIMSPIHRGYANFGGSNVQQDEAYSNSLGLFLDSYIECVEQAASIWALNYWDVHAMSGLLPSMSAYDSYMHNADTDRLHPGTKGHRRLAKVTTELLLQTLPLEEE
ncbi:MAG: SGNH/GDSL hydrolase family protein [Bacteroidaceae bacterium]|nr:SGNH/GDSL hydrolase family protein [Bacteroidaceae bacterium]MBQ2192560.1 SGNH/GDSL hydrolase family protein [Prevotella sp.]